MTKNSGRNPQSVAVFGATGYVGQALVSRALDEGLAVCAHVRPDSKKLDAWQTGFQKLGAQAFSTPWDVDRLSDCLRELRPDVVYSLLGTTRKRMRQSARPTGLRETYDSVDFGLTVMLIHALARSAPRARFVYLSSMGAGSGAFGAYLEARHRAEEALRNSGLSYTIFRPGLISGPDRAEERPLERCAAHAAEGLAWLSGKFGLTSWQAKLEPCSADELASALLAAGMSPAYADKIVEAGEIQALVS